jgi:hypothetical protein
MKLILLTIILVLISCSDASQSLHKKAEYACRKYYGVNFIRKMGMDAYNVQCVKDDKVFVNIQQVVVPDTQ